MAHGLIPFARKAGTAPKRPLATGGAAAVPLGSGPVSYPADFRNLLRAPAPAERFTIGGQDPLARPEETRRLMKGLARCLWRAPTASWPGPLRDGLEIWENPGIPAGYTYFGQLVVHDLLQSAELSPVGPTSPPLFRNHRENRLALDTIYGAGPGACPHAYAQRNPGETRAFLRVGPIEASGPGRLRDIARTTPPQGAGEASDDALTEPLVADPRNDDNVVLAQLTGVFHLLHNTVLAALHARIPVGLGMAGQVQAQLHFNFARELVRCAYRSCARKDWLRRLLHPAIYQRYADKPTFIDGPDERMPLEFSHAAARFGHAMVRPFYGLNSGGHDPIDLDMMLWLTSQHMPHRFPLESDFVIQWQRFFELDVAGGPAAPVNYSARIGPQMQRFGVAAPPDVDSLAESDLWRSATSGLWSVWALRKEIEKRQVGTTGLSDFLADRDLARERIRAFLDGLAKDTGLSPTDISLIAEEPPLAFFVLFEAAQAPGEGRHLGVMGSIIMAEVAFRALGEAGATDLQELATEIYGASAVPLFSLCKEIEAIDTLPALIRFVAREAGLERVDPPFL